MSRDNALPLHDEPYWERRNEEVVAALHGDDHEDGTVQLVETLKVIADDHGAAVALNFAAAITMRIAIEYRSRL